MFIRLFTVLLLCATASAYAAEVPDRLEVGYDVFKDDIKAATMTETFTRTGDKYHIESTSHAYGLLALFKPETIRVVSDGSVTEKGLRPATFTNRRELDRERNVSAEFDWDERKITLTDRYGKRTVALPKDTQDRLSAMYQFMFLSLQKPGPLDFHMTNGSKVDIYNYIVKPGESVKIPSGTFKAVYVASVPEKGESRTEIWLSTEHGNFPYKMVITDPDGGKFIQVLTKFNPAP
jgi:hypothetical protein